jgi:hypothetical protein
MSNNPEHFPIIHERVDELPLLLAQWHEMGVPELVNEAFATHPHWQGLSLGHLGAVGLVFRLAESNQRVSHPRSGAARHLHTLAVGLGVAGVATDVTDDRRAQARDYLKEDEAWRRVEDPLHTRLIRV